MSPHELRAGIVVTGTEVLTGKVTDRNGPWVSERLFELGCEVAHIVCVGDRPEDLRNSLDFLRDSGVDLIVTTGGLGPTADDLTAEIVAALQRSRDRSRRGDGEADRRDRGRVRPADEVRPRGPPRRHSQAGDGSRGRDRPRPGRDRPGAGRRGGRAGRDRAAGTPAGTAGDVAGGGRVRTDDGQAGGGGELRGRDDEDVRDPGVHPRQDAAGDRAGHRPDPARDHHLPATRRRARDRRPLPGRGPGAARSPLHGAAGAPRRLHLHRSRKEHRRDRRGAASRAPRSASANRAPGGCWRRA